jgi:hypothetical protein
MDPTVLPLLATGKKSLPLSRWPVGDATNCISIRRHRRLSAAKKGLVVTSALLMVSYLLAYAVLRRRESGGARSC